MAEAKTKPTEASVADYLAAIDGDERRADCEDLVALMSTVTKEQPRLWGTRIVGFGSYHYRYASGHEGDSCLVGFASGKGDISIYCQAGFEDVAGDLRVLGKHRLGKGCLYIKRLSEIDRAALKRILATTVETLKGRHG